MLGIGVRAFTPRVAFAAIAILWVGLFQAAPARAGDELFTPEHVTRLRSVGSAVISPDAAHIAYVLRVGRRPFKDDDGAAWGELHVVDQTGASRPFVTGEVNIGAVAWKPDGKGISFLAKRGKDKHRSLYVIPIDGGEARKVLSHKTGISAYSWSADGDRVAFLATEKEPKKKKKLTKKGFKAQIFEEELRPVRVWIAKPDDDEAKPRMLDLPGSASELHFSPVGTQLAVALAPTPLIDDHYMKRKVHVVDADSGVIIARIENPGKLGPVAWSSDGEHLAMLAGADLHDPDKGRLMVVPAAGGPLVDLLPGYEGQVASVAWQDADTIMFLGNQGVWTSFGEIRRDGSEKKTHLPIGTFVLSRLTLSRDGQSAAMLGQSPKHPSEVFAISHGDTRPRKLTDNNPWFARMRFAPQEVVTHAARDGLLLEGLLIRPLDEEPGRRYPLILRVHGGPESHNRNGWLTSYSAPGQVAAARGFAVLYPNYRGSTGRGVAFSKMSQADFAGKEFDDLVDAVDHFIATGLADPDRVGITGGSYGGYASAWGATYYSERFAASVMFVGLSDYISKLGTTEIPNEMALVHTRKRTWEDWQMFLQRSPMYYVEKARTPILIIHGRNDTRVHPSQSLLLHRYLKTLGQTPVRLVLYPGEGHGNRKAGARYDYNLRMLRWLEHYLKGPGGDPPPHELEYPLEKLAKDEDDEEEDEDDDEKD